MATKKSDLGIRATPPAKIKVSSKPGKVYKGKPLKDPKEPKPRTRPSGGGGKGY